MPEVEEKPVKDIPMDKVREFIGEKILDNKHISDIRVKKIFEHSFRIDVWISVFNDGCVVPLNRIINSWFVTYDGNVIKDATYA